MPTYRSHPPPPRLLGQIQREVHHSLASGRALTTSAIRHHLAPVLEGDLPATPWLEVLLAEDVMVQQVGRAAWVHVGAVLDGRVFTCHLEGGATADASQQVRDLDDLAAIRRRYSGWGRIPLRFARATGWLDDTGRLWSPTALPTGPTALVATVEGVVLGSAEIDLAADRHLGRALRRFAAESPAIRGRQDGGTEAGGPTNAGPTDGGPTDRMAVLCRVLAADHRLAVTPTRPLSEWPLQVPSRAA
ncbi:hypothetical protein [Euzebya tangerina]|uniref:hypothetical protein n=1 Tax=Euzebya tangerina TaxID=591198 RepID=UPI0013C32C7B|nr:hypothetical protein [Euzebya tangerina]